MQAHGRDGRQPHASLLVGEGFADQFAHARPRHPRQHPDGREPGRRGPPAEHAPQGRKSLVALPGQLVDGTVADLDPPITEAAGEPSPATVLSSRASAPMGRPEHGSPAADPVDGTEDVRLGNL